MGLEQEARIAGFKTEVTKSQELHLAGLTRDTERLTNNLEKIRAEIRYGRLQVQLTHAFFVSGLVDSGHMFAAR